MTKLRLHLRQSKIEDIPKLLEMIAHPSVAAGLFPDASQKIIEYLQPNPSENIGPLFVAIDKQDRLHGGGRIEADGVSYFVQRTSQRQGIGRWLLAALLDVFASNNKSLQPTLQIHRNNIASLRIAEELGFSFNGIVSNRSGVLRYTR